MDMPEFVRMPGINTIMVVQEVLEDFHALALPGFILVWIIVTHMTILKRHIAELGVKILEVLVKVNNLLKRCR